MTNEQILEEVQSRVRRVETRLTNLIKQFGFPPVEDVRTRTEELVAVTDDGKIVVSTPAVMIGDVLFAAQKHRLRGEVDVFVGNRYFGKLQTTREAHGGEVR